MHIKGTLYIILTRLLEDGVHRLNHNLSKYIAVAEESYPFLIRCKSNMHLRVQTIRRVEVYFCKIVTNIKIKCI